MDLGDGFSLQTCLLVLWFCLLSVFFHLLFQNMKGNPLLGSSKSYTCTKLNMVRGARRKTTWNCHLTYFIYDLKLGVTYIGIAPFMFSGFRKHFLAIWKHITAESCCAAGSIAKAASIARGVFRYKSETPAPNHISHSNRVDLVRLTQGLTSENDTESSGMLICRILTMIHTTHIITTQLYLWFYISVGSHSPYLLL